MARSPWISPMFNPSVTVNRDGSIVIPPQEITLSQDSFEVDSKALIADANRLRYDFPKVDLNTFLDDLTTPKSKNSNPMMDAWLSASDHGCETKSEYTPRRQRLYSLSQWRVDN